MPLSPVARIRCIDELVGSACEGLYGDLRDDSRRLETFPRGTLQKARKLRALLERLHNDSLEMVATEVDCQADGSALILLASWWLDMQCHPEKWDTLVADAQREGKSRGRPRDLRDRAASAIAKLYPKGVPAGTKRETVRQEVEAAGFKVSARTLRRAINEMR